MHNDRQRMSLPAVIATVAFLFNPVPATAAPPAAPGCRAAPEADTPVHLDFSGQQRGDAFVIELVRTGALAGVRALDLAGNALGPAAIEALAGSPALACLEHLDLSDNPLTDRGFASLCRNGTMGRLRELVLAGTGLTGDALAALPACAWIDTVRDLSLAGNDFRTIPNRTGNLAKPAALATLDLSLARCRTECLGHLRTTGLLSQLETLRLEGFFGPGEMRVLVDDKDEHRLVTLQLFGMADLGGDSDVLGDKGMQQLSASPLLAGIEHLALPLHGIGDAGAIALAGSPHGKALRHLDLRGNGIGDAGARALMKGVYTGDVAHIDLSDNFVSPAMADKLRAHYGQRVHLGE